MSSADAGHACAGRWDRSEMVRFGIVTTIRFGP